MPKLTRLPSVFWLAGIILLGLLARAILFDGVVFLESTSTSFKAWELARVFETNGFGGLKEALKYILELDNELRALVVMQGLVYGLFGATELTSILPMFVLYALSTIGIYLVGKQWLNEASGLAAALLWTILPLSIFFSIIFAPTALLLTLDIAVIWIYWLASDKQSSFLYILAVLLLVMGISSSWVIFIPTLALLVLWHRPVLLKRIPFEPILIAGLLLLLFFGEEILQAYYQLLLPLDNLWILPLLALALVLSQASSGPSSRLLQWLSVKSLWLFAITPFISQSGGLIPQGMSSYWAMIILPVLLILGWELLGRDRDRNVFFPFVLILLGSWFIVMLLTEDSQAVHMLSGIFIGLSSLMAFSLFLLTSVSRKTRVALLVVAFVTFGISSSAIVRTYIASYGKPILQLNQAWDFLSDKREEQRVVVFAEESLYTGLMFKNQFGTLRQENKRPIEILLLEHISAPKEGQFVLLTQERLSSLGAIPTTWELLNEFAIPGATPMLIYSAP
ncbi:MAG: glycosyltransferase family 39 protein [Anaerolineales bacterium]|nr:MAG: glycosyltransferase family 39 protein [Anaerolineales bacterium]